MATIQLARKLLYLLRPYPWVLPLLVILGLMSSTFEGFGIYLFIPMLQILTVGPADADGAGGPVVGMLLSFGASFPPDYRLAIIAACIVASIAAKNVIGYINLAIFSYVTSCTSDQLRRDVFRQIMALDYSYLERQRYGSIVNTLGTQTWRANDALGLLANMIVTACTLFIFTTLLIILSWKLTLLSFLFIGFVYLLVRVLTQGVRRLGQRAVEANTDLAERMWEALAGLKVIRSFGREAYEEARYATASQAVRHTFYKLGLLSALANPLSEVLAVVLVAGLVVAFGQGHEAAALSTLVAFLVLLHRLLPRVHQLTGSHVALNALEGAVHDVLALLDRSDKSYIRSGPIPFNRLERAIVADRVAFRYRAGDEPALRDVSLRIPSGRTTALVGPSGAGKSTLVDLVCRFYDVDSGEIRVDNIPLEQLNVADWRARIAIVSQDVHVFNTTIRDNIAYGRLEASEADITAAARLAHAHEFIQEMPEGYATLVGERGVRLSGGQRQRIALARAIIRDPDILILDEATNALDNLAEHLIQDALDRFGRDRTVIVIAHRLSTIERADQIIVLDHGRVVEQGDLATLVRANGLFTRLYRLQNRIAEAS